MYNHAPTSWGPPSFNGPGGNASPGNRSVHAQLVMDVLASSLHVLQPNGIVQFSSGRFWPAGFYLQGLITGSAKSSPPPGYIYWGGMGAPARGRESYPYLSDTNFAVPYTPRTNEGNELTTPISEIYWYYFQKQG